MIFSPPLETGTLIKRYKRFLADVVLSDGSTITVHCPNTGSMKNCIEPYSPCWFSHSDNPKRKYAKTLEITTSPTQCLVGVNTHRANTLVEEAIKLGEIATLSQYPVIRREVRYGDENSRIDLLLERGDKRCYVEVKNATLELELGEIAFPDAKTTRGTKHLRELMAMKQAGHRAVLFFCAQHSEAKTVRPAYEIDPNYCEALHQAVAAGVEVLAYGCKLSADEISITHPLPFELSEHKLNL